jgi:hypothetical protein
MEGSGHGLLGDEIQEFASKDWWKPQISVGGLAGIRNLQNIQQRFHRLGYDERFSAIEIKAVWMQNCYLFFKLELLKLFRHVYVSFRNHLRADKNVLLLQPSTRYSVDCTDFIVVFIIFLYVCISLICPKDNLGNCVTLCWDWSTWLVCIQCARSPSVTLLSRRAQSGRWSSFGKRVWFTESHKVSIISFLLVLFTQFIPDIK